MDYILEFLTLIFRWLHVIAAVAWIGESIYFVMLDNSLHEPTDEESKKKGIFGEMFAVHGGGFYHNQKYLVSPPRIPTDLHWSFWKAYTTWLSGFSLFVLVYMLKPSFYLVDPNLSWHWFATMSGTTANLIALGFLIGGWFVYDRLCRLISPNMEHDGQLSIAVALMMIVISYLTTHMFSGRAAFLITGAVMATSMTANVFFWIIPGQRRMVKALTSGTKPDPLDGKRGKQRSVHNTYFTLPVVFLMLSNHYPFIFSNPLSWVVLVLFIFAGALIRQYFVLIHQGKNVISLPIAGIVLLLIIAFICAPQSPTYGATNNSPTNNSPMNNSATQVINTQSLSNKVNVNQVQAIIELRCVGCHAAHGTILPQPPKGVILTSEREIKAHAAKIKELVASKYMPLGNITKMTDSERLIIQNWIIE